MTYILIHHTGCGSSKKGLALLQENGIEPEVRKYMNASSRLSVDELKDIAKKMGGVSPRAFLREKTRRSSTCRRPRPTQKCLPQWPKIRG
mgnify:CR=1 FL=1